MDFFFKLIEKRILSLRGFEPTMIVYADNLSNQLTY